MRKYEMCELKFSAEKVTDNWTSIAPEAVFTCGDSRHAVKGFYSGEGEIKVRFLPDVAGTWSYEVGEPVNAKGEITVEEALEGSHGLVKPVETHFEYQDGTLYHPFGTTVYALMHQDRALVETTFETLKEAPFNKVRLCVFPKHYDFNHNEPDLYAFEKNEDGNWDVNRPCLAFWDYMDEIITRLGALKIEADLIVFHPYDRWGFKLLTHEQSLTYLDYAIRRLAAYPNLWWSMANEYDFLGAKSMADWNAIDEFIGANDPYRHMLSNHNCFKEYDFSRKDITHCSIQTKILSNIPSWFEQYKKPISIDECCYEGNIIHAWGSISGREMTYRFWRCVSQGAYCTHGETFYSDDEILWWARGGKLKGSSAPRIKFCREIIESLGGPITPAIGKLAGLANMPIDKQNEILGDMPADFRVFGEAFAAQSPTNQKLFTLFEHDYCGHIGEDVYITFCDIHTNAKVDMNLPYDKKYKVEIIDVYDMSRETLPGEYSGNENIPLPGKEGIAVIARRIS